MRGACPNEYNVTMGGSLWISKNDCVIYGRPLFDFHLGYKYMIVCWPPYGIICNWQVSLAGPGVQCIHYTFSFCPHHICICICIFILHICHKYAIDKCPQLVQCIHCASPASLIRLLCRPQYLSKWHISPQTMIHTQIDADISLLGDLVICLMLQGLHFSSLLHAFL